MSRTTATRSKLAVILHADVVASTALVQIDERVAHERIRDAFTRASEVISEYGGQAHELRGDALLAEFQRASDAVSAALALQAQNADQNQVLSDNIRPLIRVGLALGEVVIADNTITGPGVVMAQRLEQLAQPGGVCLQGSVQESVPKRFTFEYEDLGVQSLKGFDEPVRAFTVSLRHGEPLPAAEVFVTLALAQLYLAKVDDALVSIHRAMRLNPSYPPSYRTALGKIHFAAGRYREAIPELVAESHLGQRLVPDRFVRAYLAGARIPRRTRFSS